MLPSEVKSNTPSADCCIYVAESPKASLSEPLISNSLVPWVNVTELVVPNVITVPSSGNVKLPALVTLILSAAVAPPSINLITKSKSSWPDATSVVKASNIIPFSFPAVVSTVKAISVPIPAAGIPLVVWVKFNNSFIPFVASVVADNVIPVSALCVIDTSWSFPNFIIPPSARYKSAQPEALLPNDAPSLADGKILPVETIVLENVVAPVILTVVSETTDNTPSDDWLIYVPESPNCNWLELFNIKPVSGTCVNVTSWSFPNLIIEESPR